MVCDAADTVSVATLVLFGKLVGVAMLIDFGEKRCRKKLPLSAPSLLSLDVKTLRNRTRRAFHLALLLRTAPSRFQTTPTTRRPPTTSTSNLNAATARRLRYGLPNNRNGTTRLRKVHCTPVLSAATHAVTKSKPLRIFSANRCVLLSNPKMMDSFLPVRGLTTCFLRSGLQHTLALWQRAMARPMAPMIRRR